MDLDTLITVVNDVLLQELPQFNYRRHDDGVMVTNQHFTGYIGFVDGDMRASLTWGHKYVVWNAKASRIPLASPTCFDDLKTVIMNWHDESVRHGSQKLIS